MKNVVYLTFKYFPQKKSTTPGVLIEGGGARAYPQAPVSRMHKNIPMKI